MFLAVVDTIKIMEDNRDNINQLLEKLEALLERQDAFSQEIDNLRVEIGKLNPSQFEDTSQIEDILSAKPLPNIEFEFKEEDSVFNSPTQQRQNIKSTSAGRAVSKTNIPPRIIMDMEKFIGENLINKIGIAITIIGVGIGAKYSIEHELISPLTRIILGYIMGFGLLGFGIKLKKKYDSYSAVLVSGAIAIMYFITYSAYAFYDLFPQTMAFVLMVIFTAFTVVAAINYNKQIIAHIGLVGAYAVPFLLSNGSGKVAILFSYMTIINIGILVLAFKKYWKPLYYSSFGLTWLIYLSWYVMSYNTDVHFGLALTFLLLFYTIFYLTFLAYKLLRKEKFEQPDIVLLLANSFIFYALGYSILDNHQSGSQFLGLFTLGNAISNFIVSVIIYRQKLADKNMLYLISGLVLVFITIAIPVQLDGNWVTLLWVGEAALLFWIGKTKGISFYEKLSYPLMVLSFLSIAQDWSGALYGYYSSDPELRITPILNAQFLSSMLFIMAFGFINTLNNNKKYPSLLIDQERLTRIFSFAIPAILLFAIYYSFRLEIEIYWDQLYTDSALTVDNDGNNYIRNNDLKWYKKIWIINYSLFFVSVLSFLNLKKIQNKQLGLVNLALNTMAIAAFLIQSLYALSELRDSYLSQTLVEYYQRDAFNIGIRYISFGFVAMTLTMCYKYIRQDFKAHDFKVAFDFLLFSTILWIASSELITWMDIAESTQSYKLGLSILWGVYALFLIVLGIWKKKKYLRLGAIALFGITLVKLFFYDISQLNTIAKTVVFVSLGILLLIISFLYNKYKHIISE